MNFVAQVTPAAVPVQTKPTSVKQTSSVVSSNPSPKAVAIQPAPVKPTAVQPKPTPSIPKPVSTQTTIVNNSLVQWSWPLRGKVIRGFSQAQGQQGIDIQASSGQAVFSAGPGEVVYVGNSLKGYGNLVIVKHSDTYISAYAHNSEIFVREGERVTSQQRIGSAGTNRHREIALHFQIRKNGQPVNPMLYLTQTG
ncbi:UNVERIFIED_CONTAM: hypothetical protein GTU68_002976 [Idotea baltica]|nr:hypothetical protein [Idotea baltica]